MSKILRSGVFLGWMALGLFFGASAQNITETQWYFGNSPDHLVFDKNGRAPVEEANQAVPFGINGSAVIVDQDKGNLLFYSDGENIYDASHTLLPGLGANRLNADLSRIHPVVTSPLGDVSSQFYFFTHTGTSIDYSIVDASLVGNSGVSQYPLGDITTINQRTGLTDVGELLRIVPNADGVRYWLITQDINTLEFQVTDINIGGIGATNTYSLMDSIAPFEAANLAIKEDSTGTTIAFVPRQANRNTLLANFDPITGELTFQQQLTNTGFNDQNDPVIFDAEWSEDGSILYLSRTGDSTSFGQVLQIDLLDTAAATPRVRTAVDSLHRSFGLRKGIDGRIYHLYQEMVDGPYNLGAILSPDSTIDETFIYNPLVFDVDYNGRQFPEFAPAYMPGNYFDMSITYLDSCEHSPTRFIAQVDPLPNNYFWAFGDGGFGAGPAPIHEYDQPGGYFVTLTVELNGYIQSQILPYEYNPSDSVDLGNDTTICVEDSLILDAGAGMLQYTWSTGETTQTIEVDTTGTYWVEVVTSSGCTAYDDIVVTEYGVQRNLANQWYFGEQAGLDFNFTPPQVLEDANLMDSPEGCATISDQDGQLLFYTNGSTVWNKEHQIMINGSGIGGDSTSAQSAMIIPFANDNTMFYIFTTEEVYGDHTFNLKMSIVDMKKDTARGQVMIKNVPIIECSSERVTASGFTGTPWLMAHEYGNNHFRGYQINNNGVIGAIHSVAGTHHIFQEEPRATGYMKFAPGAGMLAVVVPGSPNYIDILDFDVATGQVSNSRLINIDEPGSQAYGLEFSTDALKLYVTTTGATSRVIQYDLDSLNTDNEVADIEATKFVYPDAPPTSYGAMQMAPDGQIYIAIENTNQLATLSSPAGDDAGANLQLSSVDLLSRTSRMGLPNFTQQVSSPSMQPSITTEVACQGVETRFSGTGRDSSIEYFTWDFGDGTVIGPELNLTDTSHVYTVDSTYIVTLTLTNRCDTAFTLTDTIEVFTIPEAPTVPTDTSLCGGDIELAAWDSVRTDLNYYWSTGQTTRTVTFSSPQIVDVAIISDEGCSSDTVTVFIGQDETVIDIGPDVQICQFDDLLLDSNDPGPDYQWYRDGVPVGNQRTHQVNTNTPGTYMYLVEVTNDITGCIYTDSAEVVITAAPVHEQVDVVPAECGEANGSFALSVDQTGNFSYQVTGPTNAGPFNFDGPGTTPPVTGLLAGTYEVTMENTVTGCSYLAVYLLEDNAPYEMEAVAESECANTGDIAITFGERIPAQVEINVYDDAGANVFTQSQELTERIVRVNDLDSGSYFVEVRDLNPPHCVQTDTVQLVVTDACFRQIFVPNAFSPNGNGQNEEWFAFPNEYIENFQVYVYNRWGDLVFHSSNKNFRWDGTFAGQYVQQGTYAYRMVFTSSLEPEQGTIEQYGSVTVVK
ncbi:PKD domain-containing protein [Marinoscillum furvescens]|uniref:Gliding motility-associated-like protein n=1 Tax=Marinoscillum furvescens DSM 4134 TaxID=1122208 RepID=A0A3D9L2Z4_MARFU|nr:PKD domain-containing protein [Marinoscillum furvescens]RED97052.1 gliding motility-associated-like protein [Marinoscillum furvescens DSM 4134]